MSLINQRVAELLKDPSTVRIVSTVDEHGTPHTAIAESLDVDADGNLTLLEIIESSRTQRNLVRSIWYGAPVSLLVSRGDEVIGIRGTPIRVHVSGPLFQQCYVETRKRLGDVDLAGIWVIRPDHISEESLAARLVAHEAAHPNVLHLDRIASQ